MDSKIVLDGISFERVGDFLLSEDGTATVFSESPEETSVFFWDADIEKFSEFLNKRKIQSLAIKTLLSPVVDINVIKDYSTIRLLSLEFEEGADFRFAADRAQEFSGVKELKIRGALPNNFIDLTCFSNLVRLDVDHYQSLVAATKDIASLKDVVINNYAEDDLYPLAKIESIRRLTLILGKMKSLAGVELFPHLETLRVVKGKNLWQLAEINQAIKLENIMFEEFNKQRDWAVLSSNPYLKRLYLNVAGSVDFIKDMKALEYFFCKKVIALNGQSAYYHSCTPASEKIISIGEWALPCDEFYSSFF